MTRRVDELLVELQLQEEFPGSDQMLETAAEIRDRTLAARS